MMRSIVGGLEAGVAERGLGRLRRQGRGRLAVARDIALLDAGALLDPLVGRVEPLRELRVGDDAGGKRGADAADAGT